MDECRREDVVVGPPTPDLMQIVRVGAAGWGVLIIILGLVYALGMFQSVHEGLSNPKGFEPLLEDWAEVLGGEDLDAPVREGETIQTARPLAIVFLGVGAFVLANIALTLIKVGAQMISSAVSDLKAVKRILRPAFGPIFQTPAPPQEARFNPSEGRDKQCR